MFLARHGDIEVSTRLTLNYCGRAAPNSAKQNVARSTIAPPISQSCKGRPRIPLPQFRSRDSPGIGSPDGAGLCADPGESGSVSVWQADRQLSGVGAVGGAQWESATAGPYHETRQLSVAFLVSGSRTGHSTQPPRLAQEVLPPGDAPGAQDRQGCDGPQIRGSDSSLVIGFRSGNSVRPMHLFGHNLAMCHQLLSEMG